MARSDAKWQDGLQQDLDPKEVTEAFRRLLTDYLPMSQEKLGTDIRNDRSTVNKWGQGRVIPYLRQQRAVLEVVKNRVAAIQGQVKRAHEMLTALEGLEAAHQYHLAKLDQASLEGLQAANEGIRTLMLESI